MDMEGFLISIHNILFHAEIRKVIFWIFCLSGAMICRNRNNDFIVGFMIYLQLHVAQLDAPSDRRPGGRGFNPRRGR